MAGDTPYDPRFPGLRANVARGYLDAPDHVVAEVIDGGLFTMPRPHPRNAKAATRLAGALGSIRRVMAVVALAASAGCYRWQAIAPNALPSDLPVHVRLPVRGGAREFVVYNNHYPRAVGWDVDREVAGVVDLSRFRQIELRRLDGGRTGLAVGLVVGGALLVGVAVAAGLILAVAVESSH